MKHKFLKQLAALSALALATFAVPTAHALCGPSAKSAQPISWQRFTGTLPLLRATLPQSAPDANATPSIVGMWVVTFNAKTMNGAKVEMVIDKALVVWHADNTEIMNSGRPPHQPPPRVEGDGWPCKEFDMHSPDMRSFALLGGFVDRGAE